MYIDKHGCYTLSQCLFSDGPQTVKLTTTGTLIRVVEGTFLPGIACSSLCNPQCHYKWYKDGVQIVNGHFLPLGEIDKMKTGNYTCVAYNLYGTKESDTIEMEIEGNISKKKGKDVKNKNTNPCTNHNPRAMYKLKNLGI